MLLSRTKAELELSMQDAIFTVEDISEVVESFLQVQRNVQQGNLDLLVSSLNGLHGTAFREIFEENDFRDAVLITDQNTLYPYAALTGFYPFAVGFVFPHFAPVAKKLVHSAPDTRSFYVGRTNFRQPPVSNTGIIFVDGYQLEMTFFHYRELTNSTHFQYSKSHQTIQFVGPQTLLAAYELELTFLRAMISTYVQNIALASFHQINLTQRQWASSWDSLKHEFTENYLTAYKRIAEHLGGPISKDLENRLKLQIDISCDVMKSLLNRNVSELVNIFFRLGTTPRDMTKGILYSPINDMTTYFGSPTGLTVH